MIFDEPKVEFIELDLIDITTGSSGSMETCIGPDAPSNNCTDFME